MEIYLSKIEEQIKKMTFNKNQLDIISENVCKICEISKDTLLSDSRKANIQRARNIFSMIAMHNLEISRDHVANFINRDRSSIYHYEKVHNIDYANNDTYRDLYDAVHNSYTSGKKFTYISKTELDILLLKNSIALHKGNKFKITMKVANRRRTFFRSEPNELIRNLDIVFKKYEREYRIKAVS
jgi:hypothetical protein